MSPIVYVLFGIVIIALLVLIFIESKLKNKFEKCKNNRNKFYKNRLKRISGQSQKNLLSIEDVSKGFFREAFGFPHHVEFSEISEEFKKQGKKKEEEFSRLMTNSLYSGKKVEAKTIKNLKEMLSEIIDNNQIN